MNSKAKRVVLFCDCGYGCGFRVGMPLQILQPVLSLSLENAVLFLLRHSYECLSFFGSSTHVKIGCTIKI